MQVDKNIEKNNLVQINNLIQRGERMLSMVDLLNDKTIDDKLAGFLSLHMLNCSSFLTAANPNLAGKTTLIGSMLNLLNPKQKIIAVDKLPFIRGKISEEYCFLAHEIGSGPYYSYIWGQKAKEFFSLVDKSMVVSCIHADTLKEMQEILIEDVEINKKDFQKIDLKLFLKMFYLRGKTERRVSEIYENQKGRHVLIYKWDEEKDVFKKLNTSIFEDKFQEKTSNLLGKFFKKMLDEKIFKIEDIRKKYLKFLKNNPDILNKI